MLTSFLAKSDQSKDDDKLVILVRLVLAFSQLNRTNRKNDDQLVRLVPIGPNGVGIYSAKSDQSKNDDQLVRLVPIGQIGVGIYSAKSDQSKNDDQLVRLVPIGDLSQMVVRKGQSRGRKTCLSIPDVYFNPLESIVPIGISVLLVRLVNSSPLWSCQLHLRHLQQLTTLCHTNRLQVCPWCSLEQVALHVSGIYYPNIIFITLLEVLKFGKSNSEF